MNKILKMVCISGIMILPCSCIAQTNLQIDSTGRKISIAANVQYNKAGKFKRMILGDHYRKEWATMVDVEILDMDTAAGGLTPVKLGGGMQTKSLRLKGADGKEYVLRSVNKDPSKAIAAELRGTFAEDLVQDQISSANPFAPIVVASLASAAGIFHNSPRLVYVPSSERLGKYAETFSGTLCLLEERPSGDEQDNPHYGDADKILNSEKLFGKIFSSSQHLVDERAFLKARLFDMLIGDWDRHEDQWQWAAFKMGDQTVYQPIPRDRDQAFSKMDGMIPHLATRRWGLRKIQDFDYHIRDVDGLNTNGGHLDRSFTTRLTLSDWLEVSDELQQSLTDGVIDSACTLFPSAIYSQSGKGIAAKLKQRRNDLQQYAKQYYLFVSKEVNIVGSKDKEIFEVMRRNDDSTKVTVYNTGKEGEKKAVIYQRVFLRSETNEIRLYGLEANDEFHIDGSTKKGITIRVIGGTGEDDIIDGSSVSGIGKKTKIYDDAANISNIGGEVKASISSDSIRNNYNRRSFKYDWLAPMPGMGYNPDDGVYTGGGIILKKQGFGKAPYSVMHSIGANYAFKTGAYNFWYKGVLKEFLGKWDLGMEAAINAPNYSRNYYGLGNESKNEEAGKNYYRIRFDQVVTSASIKRQLASKHFLETGMGFQTVKVEQKDGRFVSTPSSKLDSADFGRKNYVEVKLNYQYQTLNNEFYPTKGIKFISGITFTQNLNEPSKNFVQVFSQSFFYSTVGRFTLANSSGLSTNLNNNYEFFQANTMGGSTNLRGYRKDRFAGKTSVYTNTELRFNAGVINGYMLRGSWGMLGFVDNGRVWMPAEESNKWHAGFGGGIWFLPFNKMAFTATYGISAEAQIVNIKAGFLF